MNAVSGIFWLRWGGKPEVWAKRRATNGRKGPVKEAKRKALPSCGPRKTSSPAWRGWPQRDARGSPCGCWAMQNMLGVRNTWQGRRTGAWWQQALRFLGAQGCARPQRGARMAQRGCSMTIGVWPDTGLWSVPRGGDQRCSEKKRRRSRSLTALSISTIQRGTCTLGCRAYSETGLSWSAFRHLRENAAHRRESPQTTRQFKRGMGVTRPARCASCPTLCPRIR